MKKLVRDRIPELIRADGGVVVTRRLSGEDLLLALLDKLEEEVSKVRTAPSLEELADVAEVLAALTALLGYSEEELQRARARKREAKGSFTQGVWLEEAGSG